MSGVWAPRRSAVALPFAIIAILFCEVSGAEDANAALTVEVDAKTALPVEVAREPLVRRHKSVQDSESESTRAHIKKATSSPWMARSIKEIFANTKTDKLWRHGYHRYYEKELSAFREQPGMRVLEIGASSGISLGAWLTYFKDPAEVAGVAYGVDPVAAHDNGCKIMPEHCHRLKIFALDQSDKSALSDMKQKEPEGWDIIIDDGSHKPEHQIISFQSLWEKVRPGGMYVVEDVETSYADNGKRIYGYALNGGIGAPAPKNAVEKFKELVDVVSRRHFGQEDFTVFGGIDKDVAGVNFGDGIIFVHKKPSDPEWDKYPDKSLLFVKKSDSDDAFQKYQAKINSEADPSATAGK